MKYMPFLIALYFIPCETWFSNSFFGNIIPTFSFEKCNEDYITPDFQALHKNLKGKLFGQPLVIRHLIPIVEAHFTGEPKKALVICLHGWTGIGKNYAIQLLIESIYKKKFESQFVHMYHGRLHFPINQSEYIDKYKIDIQNWVLGNVTNCARSIFIFDEIDKMPAGIIDGIKPFLDFHQNVNAVDFRKSIFVFISNIGAQTINSRYMELWRRGISRADMTYKDYELYLRNALYKTNGGFKNSAVLEGHLVSLYLPFFPLGVEEVEKCIVVELKRQNINADRKYIEAVLNETKFNKDNFALSGCKRIPDLVSSIKYRHYYEEL